MTVYYAHKQVDDISGDISLSTGWETFITTIIASGFTITGTWPIRTETASRMRGQDSNALASSIVLVCRKREENAAVITRREFINQLKRELKPALSKLQQSNIAPVDLAQAAIGPGMGVYSRYSKVLEADGSPMSVRSALQIINQELDAYFNEQDGELDSDSRFCVDLYSQVAFNEIKFGEADVLARAKNTSIDRMADAGAVFSEKGSVRLVTREELPALTWSKPGFIWMLAQQLTKAMETGGVQAVAGSVATSSGSYAESAKALIYRLFSIADRKGWAKEALAYNNLITAWPEVMGKVNEIRSQLSSGKQMDLFEGSK